MDFIRRKKLISNFKFPVISLLSNFEIFAAKYSCISQQKCEIPTKLHFKVDSNFGAVQDVAQPVAELVDQSFAQPVSSP